MKKLKVLVILAVCLSMLSIITNAEICGGAWRVNPTYYVSSTDKFYSQHTYAVSTWNSALAGCSGNNIRIYSNTQQAAVVSSVNQSYGSTGWNAYTTVGPDPYYGTYSYADMKFNLTYMNGYTSEKNKSIVTHEWGHVLGIDHTQDIRISSLMYVGGSDTYYDKWGLTEPTSFDKSQLDIIY